MYAIETDLGRFEADTEKEAKKRLRAAQRRQAKIDAEAAAHYQIARQRACCEAYKIYERKAGRNDMPIGWRIKPVTESSYCCRKFYCSVCCQRGYMIETEHAALAIFPYDDVTHVVENGAGYAMAISIAQQDVELFAVGIEQTAACWVPLPGILRSDFRASVE